MRRTLIIWIIIIAVLLIAGYLWYFNKRRRLVRVVKRDLKRYGGVDENSSEIRPYLEKIWQSVAWDFGTQATPDTAWSAAFISSAMQESGAKDFPKSANHATYVVEARKSRELGRKDGQGKMKLYRLNEHKPRIGDIIIGWRNRPRNYDNVEVGDALHGDIITEVHKDHVMAVGGNVGNTIKAREFALDNSGYLLPEQNLFAVIKNQYVV